MCGKLYVCTRKFGVYFMLQTNKVVAIKWLVATTIITESYNQHLCYLMKTFIPFNHSILAFSSII